MMARADVIGANLVLACQRTDCSDQAIIDLGEIDLDDSVALARTVMSSLTFDDDEAWEEIEGWGYDTLEDGVNRALHCPRHRTTGKGWPS